MMPTPEELFADAQLSQALTEASRRLKTEPRNSRLRAFFVELLCFDGQLERASAQLDALGRLDEENRTGVEHLLRLVAGERARRELFIGARNVIWLGDRCETGPLLESGIAALAAGKSIHAAQFFEQANAARTPIPGSHSGQKFDDFRDLDDRLSGVVELITDQGAYCWVANEYISRIRFRSTQLARDLIWRSARVELRDGTKLQAFIPALYPMPSDASAQDKLGRETRWVESDEGFTLGIGRKIFLLGDDDADILVLETLEFGDRA